MANKPLSALIQQFHIATQPRISEELSDSQLLERFVQYCDQAAFELLVWRHGTMVLNVCLRVLHREHDAEDAFQATFLALVRKAKDIGNRKSVGSWLYKVAYRVALRARATPNIQSLPDETPTGKSAIDAVDDLIGRELNSVLDEELNRLSEKYRTAFVLCQMEGQTIEAVARILGCPTGTIGTRLARARTQLRRRLASRGIDLPASVSVPMLIAALPVSLVSSTARAAMSGTIDRAIASGVIPSRVAYLTNGVLRTMILKKWAQTFSVIIGLSLFCGIVVQAIESKNTEPGQPQQLASPKQSEGQNPGVVLEWKFEKGRPFYQELTTEVDVVIKIQNIETKQKQTQTFYLVWTPLEKDGDNWRLRQTIQGLKIDMDFGGNKISFDSSQEQQIDHSLKAFYQALIGAEFTLTLNKECRVQKIDGRDDFLKKYREHKPNVSVLMDTLFSDDWMRQMAEISFGGLPKGSIRPGEDWSEKRKLGLGPLGEYSVTDRFTYTGLAGEFDKVTLRVEGNPKGVPLMGTVADNMKVNLRRLEYSGSQLFDRGKGRGVSSELNLALESTVNARGTEMDISQTQKTTIKTTDAAPQRRVGAVTDPKDREIERLREENARLRQQLKAIEEALKKKPE